MKRFLKKKWHSIPVALVSALLVIALVAGGAFAAFGFLSFTTAVFVDEPLTVEYNLQGNYGGDSVWHLLGDEDSLTLERSAGDGFVMLLRVTNDADNPLTVNTEFSCPGGNLAWFTFTGFPKNTDYANGVWEFPVSIDVDGATPAPGTYAITITFTRS